MGKSTGVLRRIDDLGRIVIPKEIRKNLKIKNGDSMEIFVDDGAIVLKKFSLLKDLSDVAQKCSNSYYEVLNKNIIVTDRDTIIAAPGDLKRKYLNRDISNELNSLLNERKIITNNKGKIQLAGSTIENYKYTLVPIVTSSDPIGSVLILSNEEISIMEEKSASFVAKFLAKHIE